MYQCSCKFIVDMETLFFLISLEPSVNFSKVIIVFIFLNYVIFKNPFFFFFFTFFSIFRLYQVLDSGLNKQKWSLFAKKILILNRKYENDEFALKKMQIWVYEPFIPWYFWKHFPDFIVNWCVKIDTLIPCQYNSLCMIIRSIDLFQRKYAFIYVFLTPIIFFDKAILFKGFWSF